MPLALGLHHDPVLVPTTKCVSSGAYAEAGFLLLKESSAVVRVELFSHPLKVPRVVLKLGGEVSKGFTKLQ